MNNYENLNENQIKILEYLKEFNLKKGYPPSIREICKAVGYKSTSSVYKHLNILEEEGYIRKDSSKPRAIEILEEDKEIQRNNKTIPLLGEIVAGMPALAQENIYDYYSIPEDLINNGDFMLRVRGDSMIGIGIYEGDYVIVQSQTSAINGDIVVALVNNEEATLKRFYKEKDSIRLQPENPTMDPIYSKDVQILGVVRALYRRF